VRDLENVTLILTDVIEMELEDGGDENLDLPVDPEDSAYLIYTSGSSGTPKGALNAHRGLCNLTAAHIEAFEVTPESRVLQFASWSFDAMASELAMSLCSGACLCLCPAESIIPGPPLVEAVNGLRITHITLPPAALQYMEPGEMPTLSHIVTAGDFCPPEQLKRWAAAKVFFNAYGVTEATVCSTIAPVSTDDRVKGVGRPMANTTVYILDGKQKMVPVGVPGELFLGGVGVAKGYLNRPELNAGRFMADPFSSRGDARMYRSGDRGRFLEDGSVELLGRIDQQIKIRGFRIEPGEIEHVLEQHPAVRQALVLASREETALAAFIEAPGERPASAELIAHCTKHLPHFMVPSSWTTVDAFPLNPNGKIDRRALLELARAAREQKRGSASPRTALELQLVGIWQEILGAAAVGIREDFFELGGHSLLAIRLLALIQQRLSVKMSLAALIEHSTIEKLAAHMCAGAGGMIPWSHLVPIQPRGTRRPLFCIHPGGGNVHGYLELARLLGDDQPLYGVQAIGFESGQEPITDIDTMAERYVGALRGVQPRGPYAIIGWCFGARAALECARNLSDLGERVDYLAFLDAYAPHVIPDSLKQSDDAALWESLLAQDTPISADELRMYRPEEQVSRVIKLAKDADLIPEYYSDEQARRVMAVFRANSLIVQSPVSTPYSGCLELFKAEEEAETARLFTSDPSLGWKDVVTGPVTVTVVPGNHNTLVRRPHVQVLAECIRTSLEKSRESS
jgi:amino acid adenylation domain-containing protein